MNSIRIFIGLFVVAATGLGLAVLFGALEMLQAVQYGGMILGGLAVLSVASLVLSAMGGGGSKGTEPPPRL